MCELKDVVACDEKFRNFYRNKTEFSMGRSAFDDRIVVGFNCGDNVNSALSVERGQTCDDVPTVSKQAFEIGLICENFIRESDIDIYSKETRKGFWRNVTIRQSERTNQILVNIIGRKDHFTETEKSFDDEIKTKFAQYFIEKYQQNEHLKNMELTGLVFQNNEEISDVVPINPDFYEILHGEKSTYDEIILGVKFEVSPSSFLQVNIDMCEKLYKTIDEYCQKAVPEGGKDYILLDIFKNFASKVFYA